MESRVEPTQPAPHQKPQLENTGLAAQELATSLAAHQQPDDWELLPADSNYTSPAFRHYRHCGTVLASLHLELGGLQTWTQLRGRPSDVIVASFPKSGTTWLQELVWRVVHRELGAKSGGDVPLPYRFPFLDMPSKEGGVVASLHEMEGPRLINTHLPYHLLPASVLTNGAKVLYVSRDPRDVCVSYYHFSRMLNPMMYRGTFAEFRDSFVRGEVMYGPYREHVKDYLEHSDTVLCVTYEQMHQDRAGVVRRVAAFLGRPVTDQEVESIVRHTSFEAMRKNPGCNFRHWEKTGMVTEEQAEGTFMRKGVVGDWRNYFTKEDSDAFMKWRDELV